MTGMLRSGRSRIDARVCVWIGLVALGCSPWLGSANPDMLPASFYPGSLAAQVVGCWEMVWEMSADVPAAIEISFPDSVSLDDSPLRGARGRLVRPATDLSGRGFNDERPPSKDVPWEQRYRVNRWWVDGSSVEIIFSDEGFGFWSLRLGLQDGVLSGPASYDTRTGPTRMRLEAYVEATRSR